jgi:hypothetical protein
VIPKVPVRQWVLSFPIPLRSLFAVHPELLAPVLQVIHRVIERILTHLGLSAQPPPRAPARCVDIFQAA